MKLLRLSLTAFVLACLCYQASAQDSLRFRTMGAFTGFGFGGHNGTQYNPIFMAGDFSWQFGKQRKPRFWAWYVEPQFNLVLTKKPLDYEFGTNMGIRYYMKLSPNVYSYAMIGSGPHYYSADVTRQYPGFLFSDNFAGGVFTRLGKGHTFLNTQFRYRHMSNASLHKPNSGINAFCIILGLSGFRE